MSNSNAAAKKRRAAPPVQGVMSSPLFQPPQIFRASMGIGQPPLPQSTATRGMPSQTQPPMSQSSPNVGLTLPQVISLVDKRLVTLETFMSETQNKSLDIPDQTTMANSSNLPSSEMVNEYNHRFELLAEEIANLKHIVLSLQSYTMDVNKMLVEERVRIFSDMAMESNPMPQSNSSSLLQIHQESDNTSIDENILAKSDEILSLDETYSSFAENITIVPNSFSDASTLIFDTSAANE